MARVSPEEAAEKWARRTGAATQDYTAGIMRVTQAPGQAAAKNQAGYLNGVQQAAASGKWARKVAAVSLPDWQRAATEKGAARLASGVAAAQPKMAAAMQRVLPMVDAAKSKINSMPRASTADRINRMVSYATEMNRLASNGR